MIDTGGRFWVSWGDEYTAIGKVFRRRTMRFIEMSGKTLKRLVAQDGYEPTAGELGDAGVSDESIVRVNLQGDIEIRRGHGWDLIGGLLGDYEARVKEETGLDWVE